MASLSKLVSIMSEFEDLSRSVRDLIKDLADNPGLDLSNEEVTNLQLVQEFLTTTKKDLSDIDFDEIDDEITQAEGNLDATLDELDEYLDEEEEEDDDDILDEDEL